MNQKEPTKTFMNFIQIERNILVSMVYTKVCQRFKDKIVQIVEIVIHFMVEVINFALFYQSFNRLFCIRRCQIVFLMSIPPLLLLRSHSRRINKEHYYFQNLTKKVSHLYGRRSLEMADECQDTLTIRIWHWSRCEVLWLHNLNPWWQGCGNYFLW